MSPRRATASAVVALNEGWVVDITEKPSREELPPYGEQREVLGGLSLYALSPRVLDHLPDVVPSARGEREFADALRLLIENGGRVGAQMVEDRLTLTYLDDLLAINRHVLRSDPASAAVQTDLPATTRITPPVHIEAGAAVAPYCQIGPEAYLETGCTLEAGAAVRRAVVLRGGCVEADQIVDGAVVA
jgi:NDP-sugar pyrophosphorylase family protein